MVFKFSGYLVKEKIIIKSLLASLKTFTTVILKIVPKAVLGFLFLLSLAVIS
jgi:hypothetical protein